MALEVERKFLVKADYKHLAKESIRISQAYLSTVNERSVRVRVMGEKGYITVKGIGNESGVSRSEWEYEIPLSDANELLSICETGIIRKKRYIIDYKGHAFEVDEFYGENEGLVVAEIELCSEDENFDKPSWLGREITGEAKYYNLMLLKNPFKNW